MAEKGMDIESYARYMAAMKNTRDVKSDLEVLCKVYDKILKILEIYDAKCSLMNYLESELDRRVSEIFNSIDPWNVRYLHTKSVRNFISHFSEIKNEIDKEWIYMTLSDYLTFCDNVDEVVDRAHSSKIYDDYIDKIAQYYRSNFGFIMVVSNTLYTIIYLTVFLVVFFIVNKTVSIAVPLLFLLHMYNIGRKKRKKEVYGLFY